MGRCGERGTFCLLGSGLEKKIEEERKGNEKIAS